MSERWPIPSASYSAHTWPQRPGVRKPCVMCNLFHSGAVCVQEVPERRTNHKVTKVACFKCGCLHYTRADILECLSRQD